MLLLIYFTKSNIFYIDLYNYIITIFINEINLKTEQSNKRNSVSTRQKQIKENSMNLVRYNPNHRLSTRPGRIGIFDEFFNDFFSPFVTNDKPVGWQQSPSLKVDIYEKDNAIFINADLPGINKEDISVDIKGKVLTIGGERKSDEEIKEEHCYRRERSYGSFQRVFTLPFEVSEDMVKASYNNGVLKLEIPKPEEQLPKKITIN